MFKKEVTTKTLVADILLKRGLRNDLPQLREGELGYIKDEERIVVGTVNGIAEVAMKNDLAMALKLYEEKINAIEESCIKSLEEKANKINNAKAIERITNYDVNILKDLSRKLKSEEFLLISKKDLDELIRKAGENKHD